MSKTIYSILELTGPAVLLAVNKGAKKPRDSEWQKITLEDMTPLYYRGLWGNIGVSLGKASNGLHSIDCDDEETFKELLELNPTFADTLQSHGSRGGNFWLRIEGDAPKTGHFHRNSQAEKVRLGEWRSTGAQTIIYGQHPSGIQYRNNGKPAITIKFADIVWPNGWVLPWNGKAEPTTDYKKNEAERQSKDRQVVETMLHSIPPRPDYDLWRKLAAAVGNSLPTDEAIEVLKAWSPEEKEDEYKQVLASSDGTITFGTLMHHAAERGFVGAVRRFYYSTKAFGMQEGEVYIPLTGEGAVRQHLAKLGVPKPVHDNLLCEIRVKQFVDYLGPLAGHKPGYRTFNGCKMVVTSGPNIIAAKKGECPFIDRLILTLLHDPQHPKQRQMFLDWLAHCRRAVLNHRRAQTPALGLTGQRGDGKSLLIEIINRCLGGRWAKGYDFFSGQKNFNSEMVGAELIVMDDDAASKQHGARVRLAQAIKANQFAAGVRMEAKNRDTINVDPVQAIVIAVNCDPEELRVLPELTDSMEDKIMLLKSRPAECHDTPEENIAAIEAELPAFLHQIEARDLSEAYDSRRRLKCFWHPEVVERVGLLSPERQLLELAHQLGVVHNAIVGNGEWSGTAADLEAALTNRDEPTQHQARRLLSWGGACGAYLGRLADARNLGVYRGRLTPKTKIQTYRITGRPDPDADGGGVLPLDEAKEDADEPF
jgi:hypothetical protein